MKMEGMKDSEYDACINNLGLLEGEQIKLQYACYRQEMVKARDGTPMTKERKGLLVFTSDNFIFMQQEGMWSSNYAQALRIPLEHISGVVSGGTISKHISIAVGVSGTPEQYKFARFMSIITRKQQIHEVRAEVEKVLKEVREVRKQLAQEALSKGTIPTMVFCKYCGAKNKSDAPKCANCGAILK